MSKWDKKFVLGGNINVDVVAILGERVKIRSCPLREAQAIQRKPSSWTIHLFQVGYHSYKATE